MTAKAYAYSRFSGAAQAKGDSLRRQLASAMAWAAEHPDVEFDPSFRDEGVSAFKGEHRTRGALAALLAKVEDGSIRRGDYILVEGFDRLSRESESVALNLLTSITTKGVKVVTLTDGETYDENAGAFDLMCALLVMSRAHEENKARQKKVAAAWSEKRVRARKTGEKLSRRGPAWTIFNEDRKDFDVIEERARIVRRIYQECNDGLGITAIASRLNAEGIPPFVAKSDGWHQGYVLTILRSPSVMGFYQPTLTSQRAHQRMLRQPDGDPIPDYYPAIIDEDTFDKAQAMIALRNKRGGGKGRRGATFPNLLIGMGRCEECGGTLILGSRANSTRVRHYRCYQEGRKHGCTNKTRYLTEVVEEHLLHFLVTARTEATAPVPDETELRARIRERAQLQVKIDTLAGQLEDPDMASPTLMGLLRKREVEASQIDLDIETLRIRIKQQARLYGEDALREAYEWVEKISDAEGDELYRVRAKANALLNTLFRVIMPFTNHDGSTGVYVIAEKQGWRVTDELFTEIEVNFDEPFTRATLDDCPVMSVDLI